MRIGHFRLAVLCCSLLVLLPACSSDVDAAEKPARELEPSYQFDFPGGLRQYYDQFLFSPPQSLTISREFTFHQERGPRTCTHDVSACGQEELVDSCDLEQILLDDYVLAAWPEEGAKVYGFDPRPQDGGVFAIEAQGKGQLIVGELCRNDETECSDRDQALLKLSRTFLRLSQQATSSPECANLEN